MVTDKILVLNIGPVEHLSTNLREILERSTDLKVKVEQRSLLETLSGGIVCREISLASHKGENPPLILRFSEGTEQWLADRL